MFDAATGVATFISIAGAVVLILCFVMTIMAKGPGTKVVDGMVDDRWFTITNWMDKDEKWKAEIEDAIDNLDALHTWTEKVSGQLEKIDEAVAPKLGKGMMVPDSYSRAVQGGDGLVWTNVRPTQAGFYWFLGRTVWLDGGVVSNFMSIFVVQKDGDIVRANMSSYNMSDTDIRRYKLDPVTFEGWWAKMEVPEFKGA